MCLATASLSGSRASSATNALASMTMRDGASSGGSSLKLVASLADELQRSRTGPHPRPQLRDTVERRERARPVTAGGQVAAKDALSGAVHILMVARGVLREPPARIGLQSYRLRHRCHEQSLTRPTASVLVVHGAALPASHPWPAVRSPLADAHSLARPAARQPGPDRPHARQGERCVRTVQLVGRFAGLALSGAVRCGARSSRCTAATHDCSHT